MLRTRTTLTKIAAMVGVPTFTVVGMLTRVPIAAASASADNAPSEVTVEEEDAAGKALHTEHVGGANGCTAVKLQEGTARIRVINPTDRLLTVYTSADCSTENELINISGHVRHAIPITGQNSFGFSFKN